MCGARGVWQFMPETAKGMGLEVKQYDERYNEKINAKQLAILF
jgi:hypothetical protein